jgi:hypothetical protein
MLFLSARPVWANQCQGEVLDIRGVCEILLMLANILKNAKNILSKCNIHVTFRKEVIESILRRQPLNQEVIKALLKI